MSVWVRCAAIAKLLAHQPGVAVKVVAVYLENWPALTDAVFGALTCFVSWLDSYYLFLVCHILNLLCV